MHPPFFISLAVVWHYYVFIPLGRGVRIGARGPIARAGLHGDTPLGHGRLGRSSNIARRRHQTHGRLERLLPALHSPELFVERSRARGGFCQRVRGGDPPPVEARPQGGARAAGAGPGGCARRAPRGRVK